MRREGALNPFSMSMQLVGIIFLFLTFAMECHSSGLGADVMVSRKILTYEPQRITPSGPSDPQQYQMNHKTNMCTGRDFQSGAAAAAPSPAEADATLEPNREVPNGPDDPYSHVKEMSSCWKPHS